LPLETPSPALRDFIAQVYLNYVALMRCAPTPGQDHLGGQLLYPAELDDASQALAIAGNIAGAATLVATADRAAGRQAMRAGVVDFVVTTLDEALRILKNQIRKHEPVAVCVSAAPDDVEREMLERGVLPDLLPPVDRAQSGAFAQFVALGARRIDPQPLPPGQALFTVEIPAALTLESAQVEEIIAASIAEGDFVNRRWLRLSPRYLGSSARRVRSVVCGADAATALHAELEQLNS
jgi:hypothetical protein